MIVTSGWIGRRHLYDNYCRLGIFRAAIAQFAKAAGLWRPRTVRRHKAHPNPVLALEYPLSKRLKMKHTTLTVYLSLCAGLAGAQTKQLGVGTCSPNALFLQMVDVGDRDGHLIRVSKRACTWSTPLEMAGLKSKDSTVVLIVDLVGRDSHGRGYVVITMENGDNAYVSFTGTGVQAAQAGESDMGKGTWNYTGGTGQLSGLKGKGTYKVANKEERLEGVWSVPRRQKK